MKQTVKFTFFWCEKIWGERFEELFAVGISLGLSMI
jgi:hypothetical protein